MIAALYVIQGGPYYGLDDVDPWPESRDARLYAGPWPVVAHPPCARWGCYWSGGPHPNHPRKKLGDDGGCCRVRPCVCAPMGRGTGAPQATHAWKRFHIVSPPRSGGWVPAGLLHPGAWTCCVEQGHYGHPARKATWLYLCGGMPPELKWGTSGQRLRLDDGYHSAEERKRAVRTGRCQLLSKRQRAETPIPFRDLLLEIARRVTPEGAC